MRQFFATSVGNSRTCSRKRNRADTDRGAQYKTTCIIWIPDAHSCKEESHICWRFRFYCLSSSDFRFILKPQNETKTGWIHSRRALQVFLFQDIRRDQWRIFFTFQNTLQAIFLFGVTLRSLHTLCIWHRWKSFFLPLTPFPCYSPLCPNIWKELFNAFHGIWLYYCRCDAACAPSTINQIKLFFWSSHIGVAAASLNNTLFQRLRQMERGEIKPGYGNGALKIRARRREWMTNKPGNPMNYKGVNASPVAAI